MINNFIAEFIGTFVFLYVILESGKYKSIQPFVIVTGLLAAIFMCGSISGGHFNPAVTTMMWNKGDALFKDNNNAVYYIIAQIAGGIMAYKINTLLNKK
jgi:glycerol uptake facilitator-like aquaporin